MMNESRMSPFRRFLALVLLERHEIGAIYFYAILSGFISLSLPLGIQSIINILFGGVISTSLIVLIAMVVLGVLANGWLQILQMRVNENIQRRIFTRYSLQFAYKLPRLDLRSVDDYYLPELVNRFFDTASLQKGITKVLLDFPGATVQIIFGIALLSFYNPVFLFFGAGLVALIVLLLRFTYPRGITTSLEESNYKYAVGFWLEEVARIIKSIKFMGSNGFSVQKADTLVSNYLDAREHHFAVLKIQYWSFVAFKVIITAALLIVGSVLVFEQRLNIGQFIAAEIVILVLINSIEKLIGSLDAVYDMLTSLEKVSKLLDKADERQGGINYQPAANGVSVQIENLSYSFQHTDSRPVLGNISINIGAGQKICIMGKEGAGKTTLLKLLTGAYSPYHGQLLIDGYPLGDYDLLSYRQHIGIHLASADIFSGTLHENLTMGRKDITLNDILQVAESVGLIGFIRSLNKGLQTQLDSLGKKLPQHTVNKILIARALLNKPRLLLLEDFWSGLDMEDQQTLTRFITDPALQCTLVAVTNNEQFARKCNHVILLDQGRIIMQGSLDDIKQSEAYQKLFSNLL